MELQKSKRSLLDFQKSLNEQFEKDQAHGDFDFSLDPGSLNFNFENNEDMPLQDNLGMSFLYHDKQLGINVRLFLPLSHLKHILSTSQYENSFLTKPWIRGFTHFRGDSFSVIDPINMFNPQDYVDLDQESRIILFKEKETLRYGLLCRDISLLDLENLYFTVSLTDQTFEDKPVLSIDNKMFSLFKSATHLINLQPFSHTISFQSLDNKKQPSNLLNLAHINKYAKTYEYYFSNIGKIQDNTQSIEASGRAFLNKEVVDLNILTFAQSLFIDNTGHLGVVVDVPKLNTYLAHTSPF